MNLKKSFLEYCEKEQFEINQNQIDIIDDLKNFYEDNFKKNFLTKILKKNNKLGFYLVGEVGVGKTMILNFFFDKTTPIKLTSFREIKSLVIFVAIGRSPKTTTFFFIYF